MYYVLTHSYLITESGNRSEYGAYLLTMRLHRIIVCTFCTLVAALTVQSTSSAKPIPETLEPTQVVRIVPKYGYSASPLRVRLSNSEMQITRRLQWWSTSWVPTRPVQPMPTYFLIEPSAENSTTIRISREAMEAVATLLVRPFDANPTRTYVVIGRTQEYLKSKLEEVGCIPDLGVTDGFFLMGATLCNRQVIVINLTGYLFLRSRVHFITSYMETRPEPPLGATSYLIADRNLSGLAHEWVHVARSQISRGFVPDNEPAWMREGLAEVVSGMARVKASRGRMTYRDFHVIRLRKFIQWPSTCRQPTSSYRDNSSLLGGCEYHRGAIALELLIANYGGLDKIIKLYDDASRTGDFFESFRNVYGMNISSFETKADRYFKYISQAATYSKS